MCVSPAQLPTGQLVGCRNCWQCRERKINDWVGRCIAESKTAIGSSVITLTYGGGDHERAVVLTYSDVQKFFKVLRKRGFPLKYFAIGEYGSAKGRCHWHVIIYWLREVPHHVDRYGRNHQDFPALLGDWDGQTSCYRAPLDIKNPYRFWDSMWPHGHMVWDVPDVSAIRYACKYLQKDIGADERQAFLAMSKKPPLGSEYFLELAKRYVDQGLAPQNLLYGFNEATNKAGEKIKFMMTSVTADNFIRAYLDLWDLHRGGHFPQSDVIDEWLDKQARANDDRVPEKLRHIIERSIIDMQADDERLARLAYRKAHNAHYFGESMSTFWSGEIFDGEEKEE